MILATIIGTAVIVAVTVAIGVFADRKLAIVPRAELLAKPRPRLPGHAAGDAAATAIRAGAAQLSTLRASQRCRECRARLAEDGPAEEIRYGEHLLLVLHFRCPACARNRSLYVEPTG